MLFTHETRIHRLLQRLRKTLCFQRRSKTINMKIIISPFRIDNHSSNQALMCLYQELQRRDWKCKMWDSIPQYLYFLSVTFNYLYIHACIYLLFWNRLRHHSRFSAVWIELLKILIGEAYPISRIQYNDVIFRP